MIFVQSNNKNKYLVANVTNKGETATTITHFALYFWRNHFNKIFNKERKSFIVKTDQVPILLQPGEQWIGQCEQNEDLEKMALDGLLYAVIFHSMGNKEILYRVKISDVAKKQPN